MNKKIISVVFIVILFFICIIAVTQETIFRINEPAPEVQARQSAVSGSLRWFRSNQGGMALEEIPSGFIALRNEYALSAGPVNREALPEILIEHYDNRFSIEVRTLYENGEIIRTQWIFKDLNQTTRVNAVFTSLPELNTGIEENESSNNTVGFIEIFNGNSFLTSEYRFLNNGRKNRTDYTFSNGFLISSTFLTWEEDDNGGEYVEVYADHFRYNRSLSLRAIERVFYTNRQISPADDPIRISLPGQRMDIERTGNLTGEMINAYPEFFGDIFTERNQKTVFVTDERNRVLSQTYYDEDDNVIWIINNTWLNDRIVSSVKIEGGTEILAEYEYNSAGDRTEERNYRNGVLERLVRIEGKTEIEELYLNGVVVLRAVWEDGRKISETRIGGR